MLAKLRQFLSYQLTIAELIGIALVLGIPYLAVGLVWSSTHTAHLHELRGADLVVCRSSARSWPGPCYWSPTSA